jgi:hypothetical protein
METKPSATSADRACGALGRREFLRGSSLAAAALSAGSALVQKVPAQQTAPAPSRPPAVLVGSGRQLAGWYGGGLPVAERLDPRRQRRPETRGDGLLSDPRPPGVDHGQDRREGPMKIVFEFGANGQSRNGLLGLSSLFCWWARQNSNLRPLPCQVRGPDPLFVVTSITYGQLLIVPTWTLGSKRFPNGHDATRQSRQSGPQFLWQYKTRAFSTLPERTGMAG